MQAKQYLQSIGRNAEVSATPVEHKKAYWMPQHLSLQAFSNFPYWIGTKEIVTVGVRYIYETSQSKTSDGYDLITFKKTKDDGTLVIEYQYKIVGGNEPQLIGQN